MSIKDVFVKAWGYIVPAASFQYFRPWKGVNYGVPFGPNLTAKEAQKIRVKAQLRASKIAQEGYRNVVYKDSLGLPTVGIGHLVVAADNLKVGDKISDQRAEEFFRKDSEKSLDAAIEQAYELSKSPSDELVLALSHVNFQLGIYWRSKFPTTWRYLTTARYNDAIRELNNSAWKRQTPVRVAAFVEAIREEFIA